jgi:hypothetical protein
MRKILLVAVILAILTPVVARAESEGGVTKAADAAKAWLALVDAGKYAESWDGASTYFKGAVTSEAWVNALKGARGPLGAVKSRTVQTAAFKTSLPGAPDGQYVILQTETSFENKKAAVETVTSMLDKDGVWRVSGYFIK